MFLFLFFISFVAAQVGLDYQLYTNSLGNEYNRVHFPVDESQTVFKLNSNCSFGPLITVGAAWDDFDIRYLPRADVSIEKYFGKGEVHPFVALQTSAEMNIGEMPMEPLLQAKNAIAGLSMSPAGKFRTSVALITGTGFHSKEDTTGVIASAGVSKPGFGIATSFVKESISDTLSPSKLSAGMYVGKENLRYIVEYDKQFDEEYNPAEISLGLRQTREWNSRDVFFFSSFAWSTSSVPGSSPRLNVGITFNLQKNKKPIPVEEPEEEVKEEEVLEEEEEATVTGDIPTEEPPPESEPEVTPEPEPESPEVPEVVEKTKPKKSKVEIGVLEKRQGNYNKRNKSKIKSQKQEKEEMPDNTSGTLTAHEVQPSAVTPESLTNITQQAGGDSNLAMLLAILAVVGGGAAWKFYSQFAEQKHEQKMKQMEIDAKIQGLGAAVPPPCQAENVKLEAEIKALKTKVNGTAALLEDVDLDLYDRKFKKLDKRLKALEDPDED